MPKPTFLEIARRAGVGTATVERVLNGRGGVRPATVEKVVAAARSLDYPRRLPEAHRGVIRIEVIMMRPDATFFARLSRAFERIAASLDRAIAVHRTFLDEANPAEIARRILEPEHRRAALILTAPDHPLVSTALRKLEAQRIPTVQIVTRISGTAGAYVGIDNYAAGRMAGLLMARMQKRPGKVVAISHSQIYQGHRDRVRGFFDYLIDEGHDFEPVAALFGFDDGDRNAEQLHEALKRWPDLAGLYNAGGANSALNEVLRKHPRGREIFFVGHELTERSARALRDGTMDVVLDQAPEAQARRAIDLVLSALNLHDVPVENPPIRFVTFTAENL
ncbi:substrate-binding domain-containing protein [Mesorhizobium sp. CU2]|uniref:LacI family DNA-binding transcriptional regulator n=1 Tax=unclassified Mesorhizobium TaxID=325217 RepID=UPI00112E2727|nr:MULTISPECIES: LacI family DNA-binding transcriptional regulator [unclassified Mesorhizobium]TPN76784.1 substrate-binding domain-containing protein [Mesorhizobium sp. CU3]TPO01769.1 substrate-binding domain-containing protein [Mesorhizobium sp. CU2]